MRILFLSGWFPYPPDNGSKLRIYNLLRGLAQAHEITLLTFSDRAPVSNDLGVLGALCSDVQVVEGKVFNPRGPRAYLGFLSRTPRSVIDTFSPQMAQIVSDAASSGEHDLVIASELGMAAYHRSFRPLPAVLEDVELALFFDGHEPEQSRLGQWRRGLTWFKQRHYVARLLHTFRACTVVSEAERHLLLDSISPDVPVEVIPNCLTLADYEGICEPKMERTLIFTGSFGYHPNYEAMLWFLEKVYPLIQAKVPGVQLKITGDHRDLPLPSASQVERTGFVDDIRPLVAGSTVSLAPLQQGGGTRLKILEAMALRTPVVATAKGAEGLDAEHGKHLMIADTPEAFALAVVRLLNEPSLCEEVTRNAHTLVREKYDWANVLPRFQELLNFVASEK